jgi:hypothetical protein
MEHLSTKRQTNEHQDNQSFRFPCSTRYFGRIVVRDQLVWVGAARVLAAARFGRGEANSPRLPASWYLENGHPTADGRFCSFEPERYERDALSRTKHFLSCLSCSGAQARLAFALTIYVPIEVRLDIGAPCSARLTDE